MSCECGQRFREVLEKSAFGSLHEQLRGHAGLKADLSVVSQRGRIHFDAEQVANRVAILLIVQPAQRDAAGILFLRAGAQVCIDPLDECGTPVIESRLAPNP